MSGRETKKHWLDYVTVWVALFAAIGSLGGAGASWYQFQASREQLQSMKFDQRPWISLAMQPEGPLDRDDKGWAYTFGYNLDNLGRSPAFNVIFTAKMIPLAEPIDTLPASGGFSFPEPTAAIRRAVEETCDANKDARSQGMGDILFPNAVKNLRWKALSQIPTTGFIPGLAVVACVTYQFSGDNALHKTVRVFDLERRGYGQMIHVEADGIVPQDLVFVPHMVEGFSAD